MRRFIALVLLAVGLLLQLLAMYRLLLVISGTEGSSWLMPALFAVGFFALSVPVLMLGSLLLRRTRKIADMSAAEITDSLEAIAPVAQEMGMTEAELKLEVQEITIEEIRKDSDLTGEQNGGRVIEYNPRRGFFGR
ncbi:hypothetical protein [Boudabousia marimammalium]|uniref:Uncharacterized protein n=1 Tax=Boudabousia marimammalium TaxID=156892 RepID=A0A1Q5PJ55_9ACTO|nr:hypothetical protein [Boudabousia marimammalium]OKL45881.1 hypothetical protein BM477_07960 [Boudabousia marimammalium]